jgi:hypothetical protein
LANASPLVTRRDGNRPEAQPPAVLSADLDRREANLAHNPAIDLGYQRDRQSVVGPQTLDDQVLGLLAVGVIHKCGNQDLPNSIVVSGCFRTDNHVSS